MEREIGQVGGVHVMEVRDERGYWVGQAIWCDDERAYIGGDQIVDLIRIMLVPREALIPPPALLGTCDYNSNPHTIDDCTHSGSSSWKPIEGATELVVTEPPHGHFGGPLPYGGFVHGVDSADDFK